METLAVELGCHQPNRKLKKTDFFPFRMDSFYTVESVKLHFTSLRNTFITSHSFSLLFKSFVFTCFICIVFLAGPWCSSTAETLPAAGWGGMFCGSNSFGALHKGRANPDKTFPQTRGLVSSGDPDLLPVNPSTVSLVVSIIGSLGTGLRVSGVCV
jgi:hypothetical protein